MNSPDPDPARRKPPRAEPLQPDLPGSGDDRLPGDSSAGNDDAAEQVRERDHADERKERSETAVQNVREGYG